jgi:hypothetical protein
MNGWFFDPPNGLLVTGGNDFSGMAGLREAPCRPLVRGRARIYWPPAWFVAVQQY